MRIHDPSGARSDLCSGQKSGHATGTGIPSALAATVPASLNRSTFFPDLPNTEYVVFGSAALLPLTQTTRASVLAAGVTGRAKLLPLARRVLSRYAVAGRAKLILQLSS
jgi:hypothetical protein